MNPAKKKSEKNKKQIDPKVEKTKDGIPAMNKQTKKNIEEVLHSTKEIVNSIKQKLDQQEIEDTVVEILEIPVEEISEPLKETVEPSLNLFDNDQVEIDLTAESNEYDPSALLEFLRENFEQSRQLMISSAKEYFDLYTQNTTNINQQIQESMRTQVENAFNLHMQRLDTFQNWISEITEKKG